MTKTKAPAKPAARKAPASKVDNDVIVESKAVSGGERHFVRSAGGESFTFPTERWSGKLREVSAVGGSFKAAQALWAELSKAKLANGVTARSAPHAAKAVSDSAAKAPAKAKPAAKAKPPAKKAEAGPDKRKLTLTAKGEAKLAKLAAADRKKDRLQHMADAKTVEAALALSNVSKGDLNYAIRTGLIEAK